jgi:Ni,Fe-hydrogenase I cytochrome b subunit
MLTILLIYFIGKRFYDLSIEYDKSKWLYAIVSVIVYYAAGIVFGVVVALLDVYIFNWGIDYENNMGFNLLGIPIGLLAVWGFYVILENKWKKSVSLVKDEIEDIGKQEDN